MMVAGWAMMVAGWATAIGAFAAVCVSGSAVATTGAEDGLSVAAALAAAAGVVVLPVGESEEAEAAAGVARAGLFDLRRGLSRAGIFGVVRRSVCGLGCRGNEELLPATELVFVGAVALPRWNGRGGSVFVVVVA